mgnify:CR=1 FL=1
MGIFSTNNNQRQDLWNYLVSTEQLKEVIYASNNHSVLFFKHSTRCGISIAALNQFENQWKGSQTIGEIYLLDLLNHRDVSNEIETITGVMHQSPQVIVVKNEETIYNASHASIDAQEIERLLS